MQNYPEGSAEDETCSENLNRCLIMELIADPLNFFVLSVPFDRRKSK
jgi:hypothetical protein